MMNDPHHYLEYSYYLAINYFQLEMPILVYHDDLDLYLISLEWENLRQNIKNKNRNKSNKKYALR